MCYRKDFSMGSKGAISHGEFFEMTMTTGSSKRHGPWRQRVPLGLGRCCHADPGRNSDVFPPRSHHLLFFSISFHHHRKHSEYNYIYIYRWFNGMQWSFISDLDDFYYEHHLRRKFGFSPANTRNICSINEDCLMIVRDYSLRHSWMRLILNCPEPRTGKWFLFF